MKKKLLKALANSSIIRAFIAKPTPKWMVYLADPVLIAFSCLLTFAFGTHRTYGTSFIYTPLAERFLNSSLMQYWHMSSVQANTSSVFR